MTQQSERIAEDDYEAIEAAVMETARGRWFLAEFARRTRAADTAALLAAVDRLENALKSSMRGTEAALQAAQKAAASDQNADPGKDKDAATSTQQLDTMAYESKILYFS